MKWTHCKPIYKPGLFGACITHNIEQRTHNILDVIKIRAT